MTHEMTTLPHYDPDRKLRRIEAVEALQALGFPVTYKTFSDAAIQRRGPPYTRFGKYTLYRWGDLIAWAEGKMRPGR